MEVFCCFPKVSGPHLQLLTNLPVLSSATPSAVEAVLTVAHDSAAHTPSTQHAHQQTPIQPYARMIVQHTQARQTHRRGVYTASPVDHKSTTDWHAAINTHHGISHTPRSLTHARHERSRTLPGTEQSAKLTRSRLADVPRCSQRLADVRRCSQMLPDAPRCSRDRGSQMLPKPAG